jgi:AraC family transcriptional activator FtrA
MVRLPYIDNIMPISKLAQAKINPLVVVVAYDGLCMFEFGVAVEIFGLPRPDMGEDWYRFAVASVDRGDLRSLGGVRLACDGGADLIERAGTIVLPGWRGANAPVPDSLISALRIAHGRGARVLSICSGAFVLAAAGLLTGRRATTHWRYAEILKERYPDIVVLPNVLYVDEGEILTSAGSAAGIDLCLHLVRRDFGTEAANRVARRLVLPPHRDGGQAQFVERAVPVPHERARLGLILDRMRQEPEGDFSIAALAREAGMSSRTFLRRFEAATGVTPAKWLLGERLAKASELLETSAFTIETIAKLSGFGMANTLRHHFRRRYCTTPVAYRSMFNSKAKPRAGAQSPSGAI